MASAAAKKKVHNLGTSRSLPHQPRSVVRVLVVTTTIFFVAVSIRISNHSLWAMYNRSDGHHLINSSSSSLQKGFVEDAEHGKTEFLWQAPAFAVDNPPRAILFLAHGRGHDMKDWWPKQPVCSDCLGLPEELSIVQTALEDFRVLVVVVSSIEISWSVQDGPRVVHVLEQFQRDWKLPIYAFGASSGATFVASELAPRMSASWEGPLLAGYISQIAAPRRRPPEKIPVVYINMNRDVRMEKRAVAAVDALRSDGIPSSLVRLAPLKIEKDFFTTRIGPAYDVTRSRAMVEALEKSGLLKDGFLTQDSRESDWRSHLASLALEQDPLVLNKSAISSILNVAWGMHEMSRDGVREALSFLLNTTAQQ